MFKKGIKLLTLLGAGAAAAKLLSDYSEKKGRVDIIPLLYDAKAQRDCGEITEEKYRDTVDILHKAAGPYDLKKIKELLDEQYFFAEDMLNTHLELLDEIAESGTSSLFEYIKNFPKEAYINGVVSLQDYSSIEIMTDEEAEKLFKTYIENIRKEQEEIIEEVKLLDGDESKVIAIFDKIVIE